MKNLLFLFSFLCLFACQKESLKEQTTNQLNKKWVATSFIINGVEAIPLTIQYFELLFESGTSSSGDFKWTINQTDGRVDIVNGVYSCDESTSQISLSFQSGDTFDGTSDFDMIVNDSNLSLTSNEQGFSYTIKAN